LFFPLIILDLRGISGLFLLSGELGAVIGIQAPTAWPIATMNTPVRRHPMVHTAGLVMHIPNRLSPVSRRELVAMILHRQGVTSAQFKDRRPQVMVIEYDPQQINSFEIMHEVNSGYLGNNQVT
jgi:hypothetical protein